MMYSFEFVNIGDLHDREISAIYSLADEVYGDKEWVFHPVEPEYLVAAYHHTDGLIGFCVYTPRVFSEELSDYGYEMITSSFRGQVTIIHHIVVHPEHRDRNVGSSIVEELERKYSDPIVCKGWYPGDVDGGYGFFSSIGYYKVSDPGLFWSDVDVFCTDCGRSDGCECRGVVFSSVCLEP